MYGKVYGSFMENLPHVQTVCTRPFLLPSNGLGTRLCVTIANPLFLHMYLYIPRWIWQRRQYCVCKTAENAQHGHRTRRAHSLHSTGKATEKWGTNFYQSAGDRGLKNNRALWYNNIAYCHRQTVKRNLIQHTLTWLMYIHPQSSSFLDHSTCTMDKIMLLVQLHVLSYRVRVDLWSCHVYVSRFSKASAKISYTH